MKDYLNPASAPAAQIEREFLTKAETAQLLGVSEFVGWPDVARPSFWL